jgi:hypothetical protein
MTTINERLKKQKGQAYIPWMEAENMIQAAYLNKNDCILSSDS